MGRHWKWYIKFPTDAYALGPVNFRGERDHPKPPGKREVRAYARKFEGVNRLPAGFQCWPA